MDGSGIIRIRNKRGKAIVFRCSLPKRKRTIPAITARIDRRWVKYSAASLPKRKRINPYAGRGNPQLPGEKGHADFFLLSRTR
jgi:hypothetical protein